MSRHIQIADNGIYSMSDGKIGAYLNTDAHASSDALGTYTDDVVKSGTIDELGKESYQLINGELTIEQGAELTGEYFEKGTPFVPQMALHCQFLRFACSGSDRCTDMIIWFKGSTMVFQ